MNVVYTFKHMKTSESVVDFAKDHIVGPISKLLGEGIQLKLVFDGPTPDFGINTLLTAPNGTQFQLKETGKNMYACIDSAGKKLIRMIRKDKNMHTSFKHAERLGTTLEEMENPESPEELALDQESVTQDKAEVRLEAL